jgi:mannose/cellobiose epimerase-like protein (N-acyl-D-glucosamine 2-epimerase family)
MTKALMETPAIFSSATIIADLKNWMTGTALPFWATTGFNHRLGAFEEVLDLEGRPDSAAHHRIRSQARQIYVYAHAAHLGWYKDGLPQALRAFDFLQARAHAPDGQPGWVHLLTPAGGISNPLRDTYDTAFLLLAFCWLAKVTGEARVHAAVNDVLAFIDAALTAPDGSLHEGVPRTLPRRQNPHMHMYEAMLALHETLDHPEALPRAASLLKLMQTRFIDPETGTLGEFFDNGWALAADETGDSIEPGHQAEWVWLLRRHQKLAGLGADVVIDRLVAQLLRNARRNAKPVTGFLIDETDRFHKLRKASRRIWLQTEMAKALIAEAEAGVPGGAAEARSFLQHFAKAYLARPVPGGWIDQFDASDNAMATTIPASSFYHIFLAVIEADRVLTAGRQLAR